MNGGWNQCEVTPAERQSLYGDQSQRGIPEEEQKHSRKLFRAARLGMGQILRRLFPGRRANAGVGSGPWQFDP